MARVPDEATAFGHRSAKLMVNIAAIHERPEERPEHESWVSSLANALSDRAPPQPTSGSWGTKGTTDSAAPIRLRPWSASPG